MSASDDRRIIEELVYAYAERLDEGDLEGVAALFARGTVRSDREGRYEGAAAVREMLRRSVLLYDGKPRTKHVITNLVVEIDDDRSAATARSYFTVLQATGSLPLQPVVAGRYRDAFVAGAGAWSFRERFIHVDLVGDLREHLKRPLEGG